MDNGLWTIRTLANRQHQSQLGDIDETAFQFRTNLLADHAAGTVASRLRMR